MKPFQITLAVVVACLNIDTAQAVESALLSQNRAVSAAVQDSGTWTWYTSTATAPDAASFDQSVTVRSLWEQDAIASQVSSIGSTNLSTDLSTAVRSGQSRATYDVSFSLTSPTLATLTGKSSIGSTMLSANLSTAVRSGQSRATYDVSFSLTSPTLATLTGNLSLSHSPDGIGQASANLTNAGGQTIFLLATPNPDLYSWGQQSLEGTYSLPAGDYRFHVTAFAQAPRTMPSSAGASAYAELSLVPEPSTLALLGIGAIGLLAWALRRGKRAVAAESQ